MILMHKPLVVELVYDRDCPNVERAREMIRAALHEVGADPVWTEWDRESIETPTNRRQFGSPTVLVNGHDIGCDDGDVMPAANACRVYLDASGCLCGAPSSRLIVDAINAGAQHE
jgi:mercuric ion transport protein